MINPASVPLSVQQTANTFHLGTPQSRYATGNSYLFTYSSIFALFVGCIVLCGLPDFLRLVGVAWILVGVSTLLFSLLKSKIVVFVYPEGLIYIKRGQIEVLRWDQMEVFWKQIITYDEALDEHEYQVCRNDGVTFVFGNSIQDVKALGSQIEQATMRVLLPRFIAHYAAGNALSFESICISPEGIRMVQGQKFLFWEECESSSTTDDMFYIYKNGQKSAWECQAVSVIPNANVLKELINYILQERASRLLPHMLVDYRAGFLTLFGELSFNAQGISVHDQLFQPWQEIRSIDIDISRRLVSIYLHNESFAWKKLPTWMTPNVFLLKALVESITPVYVSV